tara:strand:- start:3371 stop:3742 length:372 start_codon:yes stop_codon:yes gene_type:complete
MIQLNLGQLIELVKDNYDEEYDVEFDFGSFSPAGVESYRGYYNELSITFNYECNKPYMSIKDFLKMLEDSVGKSFKGYKGEDFEMGLHTPLWVSNYGMCSNTSVRGVYDTGCSLVIETRYCIN